MARRLFVVIVLALLPITAWAQQAWSPPPARTTPAEVAAAMLPCVGQNAYMGAGTDFAWIDLGGGSTVQVTRTASENLSQAGWYRPPGESVSPPLTLEFFPGELGISRQGRWHIEGCIQAVYPPR